MGSGTTLGESVKVGAKAVGCDINPVSTFMVKQQFQNVDLNELRNAFRRVGKKAAGKIRSLYVTEDPETGKTIPVLYFFWVKTVRTPSGEEIPLFKKYIFSRHVYPEKNPTAHMVCPGCLNVFSGDYGSRSAVCGRCGLKFDPHKGSCTKNTVEDSRGKKYKISDLVGKDGPPKEKMYACLALRENSEKIYLPVSDKDIRRYSAALKELRENEDSLPLPANALGEGRNTSQAVRYGYLRWRDFFNGRQLLALGTLLKAVTEEPDELSENFCSVSFPELLNLTTCSAVSRERARGPSDRFSPITS